MIKKDVFGEKKFTNRLNSLGNMVYINRKLKWSQNHLLRNLRNEVSLKTCFLEFLNFQNSFFLKLEWLFPVEINNSKVINIVRQTLYRATYSEVIALSLIKQIIMDFSQTVKNWSIPPTS